MQIVVWGIISIVMGLACFTPFLFSDVTNLIVNESNIFIVKYSLIILLINGGLYFITLGMLILKGEIVPFICAHDKIDKIKNSLLGTLFMVPAFLSISLLIFELSNSMAWKVIWSFIVVAILISLYSDIRSWKRLKLSK